VLYGCYLDEGMVRLIMNVHSLAVHFEKAAVRELVTSLAPETLSLQAKSIPHAPKPQEAARPDSAAEEYPVIPEISTVPAGKAPAEPQPDETSELPKAARSSEERSRPAEEERRRQAAAKAGEEVLRQEESEKRRKEEDARLRQRNKSGKRRKRSAAESTR